MTAYQLPLFTSNGFQFAALGERIGNKIIQSNFLHYHFQILIEVLDAKTTGNKAVILGKYFFHIVVSWDFYINIRFLGTFYNVSVL